MTAYIIIITAILTYFFRLKKISLLMFVLMATNMTNMLPIDFLSIKWNDMAIVYTVVIATYSLLFERKSNVIWNRLFLFFVAVFIVFMFFSCRFSHNHYEFTYYQILQGARSYILLFSFIFLIKTDRDDVRWILRMLLYITLIHSILYVIQVTTRIPVLPYGEAILDFYTHTPRYYNFPFLIDFFIYITILYPRELKSRLAFVAPFLLIPTLIATQNRMMLIIVIMVLLVGVLMKEKLGTAVKTSIILLIALLPFVDFMSSRIGGNETRADIQAVIDGKYVDNVESGKMTHGGTLTYRFAWVYERRQYLSYRPLSENIFGLGFIGESQWADIGRFYDFKVGLFDEEIKSISQLTTPDIAYGNLLCRFGYFGGVLVLLIWLSVLRILFVSRRLSGIISCAMLLVFEYFPLSLAGSLLSDFYCFVIPFLAMSIIPEYKRDKHILNKLKLILLRNKLLRLFQT